MTSPDPNLTPEHAVLSKDAGTWDAAVEVKIPGAPPQRSKGVSVNRLIAGGLWLVCDFQNETGFEGHGVFGYDPRKKGYVGTWVDDMRTFLAPMEGTWDAESSTMTFRGEAPLGERTLRWRETTQSIDADTRVFRSFMAGPDGTEAEVMTVRYTRRKA